MRILLLFPMADGQTGPAIKHAFEKLGYEVEAVDAKRHPLLSYSIACGYKPDLVFCSRTKELTGQVTQIKRKFPNAITCMWNMDTRYDINHWIHLFPLIKLIDYHFVPDTATIPRWREINSKTFWLPQGLQNEIYGKPKEITKEDTKTFECEVSFAGRCDGTHRWRIPYLDAIEKMGVKFRVWGCKGHSQVYDEEHNKMVSLSKINLCCSGWPENEKYTSVRNYKIMGVEGFVLELNRRGIGEVFPIDVFGCYETPSDLVNKIRYWLIHEGERKDFAKRGYKWVHENATYTDRIKGALSHMGVQS